MTSITSSSSQLDDVLYSIQNSSSQLIRVVSYLLQELRAARITASARKQTPLHRIWPKAIHVETLQSLTKRDLAGKRKRSITHIGGIPIAVILSSSTSAPNPRTTSPPTLFVSSDAHDSAIGGDADGPSTVVVELAGRKLSTPRRIKGWNVAPNVGVSGCHASRRDWRRQDKKAIDGTSTSISTDEGRLSGRSSARSSGSFTSSSDGSSAGVSRACAGGSANGSGSGSGIGSMFGLAPVYGAHKDVIRCHNHGRDQYAFDTRAGSRSDGCYSSHRDGHDHSDFDDSESDSESEDEDDVILLFEEKCRI
ncbi:hypothetical protein IAU59_006095 [Kwoniella sp. CBS 9459]